MSDLGSTVNQVGKKVTQILHFESGNKKTYDGVLTDTIKQGQYTKFMREDGSMVMVNDNKIEVIEIYPDE